ncbi:MAG: hypothetical protein H0X25_16485, partial [Acidobacteriales bacterium]|nr:hypothetical protein [Terriglobales bacterium]
MSTASVLTSERRRRPRQRKSPTLLYWLIAIVLLVAVAYQVRLSVDVVHSLSTKTPFFDLATASNRVAVATPDASALGIRIGDQLLEVNGRPYRGTQQLWTAALRTSPGSAFQVAVRSPGIEQTRVIAVPVVTAPSSWAKKTFYVLLNIVMPVICILLGCWVVMARPRDYQAWLLLGLLLGFTQLLETHTVTTWGSGFREAAMIYHIGLVTLWPVFMFLFAYSFPEPFPAKSSSPLARVRPWIALLPLLFFGSVDVVASVAEISDYSKFDHLYR